MDAPRLAFRFSAVAAASVAVALVSVVLIAPAPTQASAVTQRDGSAFALPEGPGVYEAQWRDEPILVYVVDQAVLDGVEAKRGPGQATDAIPLANGLAVFAFSARSNFLGCTGIYMANLGASKDIADYDGDGVVDGRFMDSCHQGQWDVFHRGAAQPGTPTCGRLAMLRIALDDGGLVATGFDGPVGAQHNTSRC